MPRRRRSNRNRNTEVVRKQSVSPYATLGTTGLMQYGGIVREEFLRDLQGRQAIQVYREMSENDALIGATLKVVTDMLRSTDWFIRTDDDTLQENVDARDFVEDNLFNRLETTWSDLLGEILTFLPFGFSFFETIYERKDGKIYLKEISPRSQDTLLKWVFDENGKATAFVQQSTGGNGIVIPFEKGLLFRTTSGKGNPAGQSVLRNSYVSWYRKNNIEQFEGIGVERDMAGLPVIYVPPEWTNPDADANTAALFTLAKDIVRNLRRDEQEGVVLPSVYDNDGKNQLLKLELLSASGKRQYDTDAIIKRYDQRIAMSMLADFMLLGHEAVGSFALSDSKTSTFSIALQAYAEIIIAQFNRKLIPQLLSLNGMRGECYLAYGDFEKQDMERLGAFIERMIGSGALTVDDSVERLVRDVANLPDVDEGTMIGPQIEPMGDELDGEAE